MQRRKKLAFIDGDGICWGNPQRMEIAAKVACGVTGMLDRPTKPAREYPTLLEAGQCTLRRIIEEGKEDKPGEEKWERADVQGDYGPVLYEEEYCREDVWRWERVRWRTAFMPDLVFLDFPLPGVMEHLAALVAQGYEVWVLTSNPDSTREARLAWMTRYHFNHLACSIGEGGVLVPNLITKPSTEQYTKTFDWKAQTVVDKVHKLGALEVVTVDDTSANLDALHAHPFWQTEEGKKVHVYSSTSLKVAAAHVAHVTSQEEEGA